jgi:hypothetical protein
MPCRENRTKGRWPDRLVLWLSVSKRVDGLWVGSWDDGAKGEAVLGRIEAALCLIKTHDRLRYERLIRDLERVWVLVLAGSFNKRLMACQLDTRYVLDEASSLEMIASTIVHEATHARLMRCCIGYEQGLRARVEAVCLRRELAFAARLPNGARVRELAERSLELCAADYWTDSAFDARHLEGAMEALRHLGAPNWLLRPLPSIQALCLSVRRRASKIFAKRRR